LNQSDWNMLAVLNEERNLTQAAARLFTAQSSLSYRIKKLEEEFGVALFSRIPRGIVPTDEGEYLIRYAKEMQQNLRNMKENIQTMRGKIQGTLRLGATTAFAYYKLPEILKDFRELYPHVEIFLKVSTSQNVYRMLNRDEVSLVIVRGDHPWLEEKRLLSDEAVCLVSKTPIDIPDLPNHPQIIHPTSGVFDITQKWWQQNFRVPPHVSMEVNNLDICLQMVMQGLGWSVMPMIGIKDRSHLYTEPLFWSDGSPLHRQTWIMLRNVTMNSIVVQTFIKFVVDFMRK